MRNKLKNPQRPCVLFVGAFPPSGRKVFGGMVTSCKVLLESSFSVRTSLILLDSTQVRNPPPGLLVRFVLAFRRICFYFIQFERYRPDAVLLFTSMGASLVEKGTMAWYARMRGVPALIFPRGGALIDACLASRFTRTWVRLALRGANTLLCQGPAWQRFAVGEMGFESDYAPLVPNWTATPALLAIGRERRFAADQRPVPLIFVGWLEEKKGIFELLEACRQLSASRKFVLNIVGDGHASPAAREFVVQHRLEPFVVFSGWLQGIELRAALAASEVLVLPSWAEGLPNAMIEAMAARLAVIVSAVGNVPDVVVDGRDGLLVPAKDIVALTNALARVIDDPELRRELGNGGFTLAEREFSAEQAADRLVGAVNKAISCCDRMDRAHWG